MTSVRFVGALPLWPGLLLAVLVAIISWRFYRRESLDLPARLRWSLPLLRSLAFALGILILTGPVLHHRQTIGELGRVKLYVDASASMTLRDQHMSVGRKLLVAEQLGWLAPGKVDTRLIELADELFLAGKRLLTVISSQDDQQNTTMQPGALPASPTKGQPSDVLAAAEIQQIQKKLLSIQTRVPEPLLDQFTTEVLRPVNDLAERARETPGETPGEPVSDDDMAHLRQVVSACERVEQDVRQTFEATVSDRVASGDEAIASALVLFDEHPRWRRIELGLTDSSADVLARLQQKHDVEIFVLSGPEAVLKPLPVSPVNSSAGNAARWSLLSVADGGSGQRQTEFANLTDLSSGLVGSQQGLLADVTATTTAVGAETVAAEEVAVEGTTAALSDLPQTALVLLSDGQHNAGPSPLQTARVLGAQGLRFYCVSVGATRQAPDLALIEVEHPSMVFQKDLVRGVMVISDQMPAGRPFVAQISHDDQVLWSQQLLTQNIRERRIEFEFGIEELVDRVGTQLSSEVRQHALPLALEAALAPLADESETENNRRTIRLAAITENHRVLLLDGRSRWETRYLRNVFERDDQWHIDSIIAGPGTDDMTLPRGDGNNQFPTDRDSLFRYDLIIFGEISPELFTEQEFTWLREFVTVRGGGMVFIDGQRGVLRELNAQNLATLIPVEWRPDVITARPGTLQLTDRGAAHSALKLQVDEQQNRRFWTELPPPHNLIAAEALPGAEILAEINVGDKQYPALVTHRVGAGRVLYLAFDETWRWRYKAADTWHQRIWNQLAGFVIPPPFAVSDEFVSIDSGPVSYDFGDAVDLRIRLLGLDGKPVSDGSTEALVWRDGRVVARVTLDADPTVPGIYRGRSAALPQGDYEVSVRAAGFSESVLKARTQFVVRAPESNERAETAANEELLKQMAEASGGRYLREEQMGELPDLLSPLSSGRVVESESLLWQSYWWFAAIVMLLTAEWLLRKRAGLL
ncbi:MAG: hypothetical protein RIK87_09530 [Fuerstiella sp.]